MGKTTQLNVLGEALKPCSLDPLTGYFRNGCCQTDASDRGSHVVCAVVTAEFLEFSMVQGNDLMTRGPRISSQGLNPETGGVFAPFAG